MKSRPNKYELYARAVQDPEATADFLATVYWDTHGGSARTLREDFCGTFALSEAWVAASEDRVAHALDREAEPLAHGKRRAGLDAGARARLHVIRRDVTRGALPRADVACALNFSYCALKERPALLQYFERCRRSLRPGGVLVVDCLGGVESEPNATDRVRYPGFTYLWERESFDPFTREALFHIHFEVGSRRIRRAFSYDWRLWTPAELRDLFEDAGFSRTELYWEGIYRLDRRRKGRAAAALPEDCRSWVAYLAAVK